MRTRIHIVAVGLLGILLAAVVLGSACENLSDNLERAADIIQEHPELIRDEEDREKWLQGARTVKSFVSEIETPQEVGMGQALAVLAFASFGRPYPDEGLQTYVAKIGKVVAFQSSRPTLPYSFAVVESEEPNALALPGGFVFVSTGLLLRLDSESELACILGHEICHVAEKHGIEIVERDRKIGSVVDFGAVLDEDVAEYREFIDLAYTKLTTEGYDREYETRADKKGTQYAFRAGYHPAGLMPFLEADARSDRPLAFEVFKTHPDPDERIRKLRKTLKSLGGYDSMPRLDARYNREVLDKLR
jgi:predicted Zn-dependent protease